MHAWALHHATDLVSLAVFRLPAQAVLGSLVWLFLSLGPAMVFLVAIYLLFSLPLRRRQRAALFLDLLEINLRQGRPREETLVALSHTQEPALGVRFHLLAAHVENGCTFRRALELVPRLLPPSVTAMLRAGECLGDLARVIPACRQTLNDATAETRSAVNYLVVLAFVITPFSALLPWFLFRKIVPTFRVLLGEFLEGTAAPLGFRVLEVVQPYLTAGILLLMTALWIAALAYVGGPRFSAWVQAGLPRVLDWVELRVPWRRKRMQRDFSSMLAVLLDAGVAEAEALRLAGDCAANTVFQQRVECAVGSLQEGAGLTNALARLDDRGEFRWRLANAAHGQGGFLKALTGWHEALDARAYQQEQAAAQAFSTGLVLLNGLFVAAVMFTVFSMLIAIIEAGFLW